MNESQSEIQGKMHRHTDLASDFVIPRPVDVWLPPGYADQQAVRYPVIYMHDGQNLFDANLASIGVDWGVDEAVLRLVTAGKIPPVLVVGVWCTEQRWQEYMPQKALRDYDWERPGAQLAEQLGGPPQADNYLRFLVQELKPWVDSHYRTRPEGEHTLVMGSSMGGLISLYALCEYPQVFGAAGCLSTHWSAGEGIVIDYLREALPQPGAHRVYFDYGTETLDVDYEPYQHQADEVMRAAGYIKGRDWITCKFVGAEHSERAWRERVHVPLEFLLAK